MTSDQPDRPAVSIILPAFNRARFLVSAFASIKDQVFRDWELIVVDDGSDDGTPDVIAALACEMPRPVRYVYQENLGAYSARNHGLDLARGHAIAFFDSDDIWLSHHLHDSMSALGSNLDVDWVYAASRIVDHDSGRVIEPNHFLSWGVWSGPIKLPARTVGALHILDQPGSLRAMISDGNLCMLQNSVIRRRVFEGRRFRVRRYNEAEDYLFAIRSAASGFRLAYIDEVHSIYNVHEGNSSPAAKGLSYVAHRRNYESYIEGLEEMVREGCFDGVDQEALIRKLSHVCFWSFGYALLWTHGERRQALKAFRKALKIWPWDLGYWKTYLLALTRTIIRPNLRRS